MLEFLFNKVAGLQVCMFIKKRLQHKIILRTYSGGGGSMKSVQVCTREEGEGFEIGDFTAYVLYGCPLA